MPVIQKAQSVTISDEDGDYVEEASEEEMETTPKGMVLPDMPIFGKAPKKASIMPWVLGLAALAFFFSRKK